MKYKLTDKFKTLLDGTKLYQIQALKDFGDVKAGELGGWIEKEANLSQEGNCWVFDDARVFGDARVWGDAWVCGNAEVFGDARVCGDAWVYGGARVFGDAWVFGDARVFVDAWVSGNAEVFGSAWVEEGKIAIGSWERQPTDEELLWCGSNSEVGKLLFS
jgi:hypothetical protein